MGVSVDGLVVVGGALTENDNEHAFRWHWEISCKNSMSLHIELIQGLSCFSEIAGHRRLSLHYDLTIRIDVASLKVKCMGSGQA